MKKRYEYRIKYLDKKSLDLDLEVRYLDEEIAVAPMQYEPALKDRRHEASLRLKCVNEMLDVELEACSNSIL